MDSARLLFPALRWREPDGFEHERPRAHAAVDLGVGGFILFGGEAGAVRTLTTELTERAGRPLLFGSDLERGAGQQFSGATPLPPAGALGHLDDAGVIRRAAELTAGEAAALGVGWVYAPMADLDVEPANPIVGSRAFGADPGQVSAQVAEWVRGCARAGGLSCAKHFPGHGRTTADSHAELPRVDADREALEADLAPFRAAVHAGVDSIMTAHVVYGALDPGRPATLSRRIITDLLRGELAFDGLVVTDALIMEGVLEGAADEGSAAVEAVAAGCDALLYPADAEAVAAALRSALGRRLAPERVREAVERIDAAAAAVPRAGGVWGREEDADWALDVSRRALVVSRGSPAPGRSRVRVLTVDDDAGGPYPPPSRDHFARALSAAGVAAAPVAEEQAPPAHASGPLVVALYCDIRAWKGRPGLSREARERVERAVTAEPDATVVLFGHPRLAAEVPGAHVLSAWGGEPLMQRAAATWLVRGAD